MNEIDEIKDNTNDDMDDIEEIFNKIHYNIIEVKKIIEKHKKTEE